jgi:hypothetical protein
VRGSDYPPWLLRRLLSRLQLLATPQHPSMPATRALADDADDALSVVGRGSGVHREPSVGSDGGDGGSAAAASGGGGGGGGDSASLSLPPWTAEDSEATDRVDKWRRAEERGVAGAFVLVLQRDESSLFQRVHEAQRFMYGRHCLVTASVDVRGSLLLQLAVPETGQLYERLLPSRQVQTLLDGLAVRDAAVAAGLPTGVSAAAGAAAAAAVTDVGDAGAGAGAGAGVDTGKGTSAGAAGSAAAAGAASRRASWRSGTVGSIAALCDAIVFGRIPGVRAAPPLVHPVLVPTSSPLHVPPPVRHVSVKPPPPGGLCLDVDAAVSPWDALHWVQEWCGVRSVGPLTLVVQVLRRGTLLWLRCRPATQREKQTGTAAAVAVSDAARAGTRCEEDPDGVAALPPSPAHPLSFLVAQSQLLQLFVAAGIASDDAADMAGSTAAASRVGEFIGDHLAWDLGRVTLRVQCPAVVVDVRVDDAAAGGPRTRQLSVAAVSGRVLQHCGSYAGVPCGGAASPSAGCAGVLRTARIDDNSDDGDGDGGGVGGGGGVAWWKLRQPGTGPAAVLWEDSRVSAWDAAAVLTSDEYAVEVRAVGGDATQPPRLLHLTRSLQRLVARLLRAVPLAEVPRHSDVLQWLVRGLVLAARCGRVGVSLEGVPALAWLPSLQLRGCVPVPHVSNARKHVPFFNRVFAVKTPWYKVAERLILVEAYVDVVELHCVAWGVGAWAHVNVNVNVDVNANVCRCLRQVPQWDVFRRQYRRTAPWLYEPIPAWLGMIDGDAFSHSMRPFLSAPSSHFANLRRAVAVRCCCTVLPCCDLFACLLVCVLCCACAYVGVSMCECGF